jgi:hypothetical protein
MKFKVSVILCTGFLLLGSFSFAGVSQDKIQSSIDAFSKGLDRLLLDTAHVYVRPGDNIVAISLPGIGVIFTGNISITSQGGLSVAIGHSLGIPMEIKIDSDDSEKDLKSFETDMKELDSDMKELSSELSKIPELKSDDNLKDLSKLAGLKNLAKLAELGKLAEMGKLTLSDDGKIKIINLGSGDCTTNDKERLEKMGDHIKSFKGELIQTILDFAPVLKGLESEDRVIVALHVAEKEYRDAYGTSNLLMQIPFKKLMKIIDLEAIDPEVTGSFEAKP